MLFGSDQTFGTAEAPLAIEPWNGRDLAVSAIALGAEDFPMTDVAAGLENSLIDGPRRLAANGREMFPMGNAEFRAGTNGFLYFEVYAADAPKVQLQILDRASRKVIKDSGAIAPKGWLQNRYSVPIALNLPTSTLAPGTYTLELRVMPSNNADTTVRRANFSVK
jgi:hypothetical protein